MAHHQVLSYATAAMAGIASSTFVWLLWAWRTPGDYFANGNFWVGPTLLAGMLAGSVGGYFAHRYLRIAVWLISVSIVAYAMSKPSGWWAKGLL